MTIFSPLRAFAAGSASLSLSPSSGSYATGATIPVTIRENSGAEAVNVVEVVLSYDASKLQFAGINNGSSAFDSAIDNSGGGGSVHITRYKGGGGSETGSQIVSQVNFVLLASSGSASINFGSGSHIVSTAQQELWNGSTSGASFTVAAPASGGSSSFSGSTGSGSSSNKSAANAVGGANPTTPGTTNPADPTQTVVDPVTGETTTGTLAAEEESDTGFLVAIKVVNSSGAVLAGYGVKINDKTAITDDKGIASFTDIAAGTHDVEVQSGKQKTKATIEVHDNVSKAAVQVFEIKVSKSLLKLWVIGAALTVIVFAIISGILTHRRLKKRSNR